MSPKATTLLGLIRDVIVAVIGVLVLVGVEISDSLLAGILLLVSTLFALGSWLYMQYKAPTKT